MSGDIVNKEPNIINQQKPVKNPNWKGADQLAIHKVCMQELNSGLPKTNPASGREESLNPGPPAYKSGILTTRPRLPPWLKVNALLFTIFNFSLAENNMNWLFFFFILNHLILLNLLNGWMVAKKIAEKRGALF